MKKIFYGIVLALTAILLIPNTVSAAPTTTKESTEWSKIVANFKNTTVVKNWISQNRITIDDDAYGMTVTVDIDENNKVIVDYAQAYGIVRYEPVTVTSDAGIAMAEYLIHYNLLTAIAQNYNYDVEKFFDWLDKADPKTLTVDNDGIQYELITVEEVTNTVGSGTSSSVEASATTFKSFAVNIDCGIQSYKPTEDPVVPPTEDPVVPPTEDPVEEPTEEPVEEPEEIVEETVENPDTGLYISLGLIISIIVGVAGFMISKNKTYFNKI